MLFILFCIVIAFLMWLEIIPVRKRIYSLRAKSIGIKSRFLIGLVSLLDKLVKCIEWLLE